MVYIDMTLIQEWEDRDRLQTHLAEQLTRGSLAMVLGSGISVPFGLPDWKDLVGRLYTSRAGNPSRHKKPERQVEAFRKSYFKDNTDGFLESVRLALYKGIEEKLTFQELRKNATLAAIGALAMSSCRGHVAHIITLNFDNLLELYLQYQGYAAVSVIHEQHWTQTADVTIYHPHGYLPADQQAVRSNSIILDETSYKSVVGNPKCMWYQELLTILRTHTCLFIGLSGDDPDLYTLMLASKKNHVCRDGSPAFWGVSFTIEGDPNIKKRWMEAGVFVRQLTGYEEDLPDFLFGICQKAANQHCSY